MTVRRAIWEDEHKKGMYPGIKEATAWQLLLGNCVSIVRGHQPVGPRGPPPSILLP